MKLFANIVLFIFMLFLATPTIVSVLQDKADISMFYSFTEEEIQKEIKEVKAAPHTEVRLAFFEPVKKTAIIHSANQDTHVNVSRDIHSPPPNTI